MQSKVAWIPKGIEFLNVCISYCIACALKDGHKPRRRKKKKRSNRYFSNKGLYSGFPQLPKGFGNQSERSEISYLETNNTNCIFFLSFFLAPGLFFCQKLKRWAETVESPGLSAEFSTSSNGNQENCYYWDS